MPGHIELVKCTCQKCGRTFEKLPSYVRKGQGKYCSRKCAGISKNRIQRFCKICDKPILLTPSQIKNGEGKYCSHKCRYEPHRIKCVCKNCNKIFYRIKSQIQNGYGKYCCENCKYEDMHGPTSHFWVDGRSFGSYCQKFNKEFKERVRAYFGYKCFMCGELQKGEKLHVHHVDYDKKVCCNDNIPLFVPLCRPCHSRTSHNDRDLWSAYFRMGIYQHTSGTMKTYYTKEEMKNRIRLNGRGKSGC